MPIDDNRDIMISLIVLNRIIIMIVMMIIMMIMSIVVCSVDEGRVAVVSVNDEQVC